MNRNLKSLGKFTFHFTTAIYLLAVPATWLVFGRTDSLMPYESGVATFLSVVNGGLAAKHAWRALK